MISYSTSSPHAVGSAVYEGDDLSHMARIIVDKDSNMASLNIIPTQNWRLYSGPSVDAVDFSKPIASGDGSGEKEESINLGHTFTRCYYQLVTDSGKAILADRSLPMAGAYNFRDIGGMRNQEGRYVKWGKIIRADDLYRLTEKDLNYLSGIPIKCVVDFREKEEQGLRPDRLPRSVEKEVKLSINPGNIISFKKIVDMSPSQIELAMTNIYLYLVSEKDSVECYREFFKILQQNGDNPLLFHCSAGKDRTGMGTALILYALGVDEQMIMEDYLASNVCLEGKFAKELALAPNLKPALIVKKEFLEAGVNQIKKMHGSVVKFIEDVLDVDIPALKERFLY